MWQPKLTHFYADDCFSAPSAHFQTVANDRAQKSLVERRTTSMGTMRRRRGQVWHNFPTIGTESIRLVPIVEQYGPKPTADTTGDVQIS